MTASELRDILAGLMQKTGGDPEVMLEFASEADANVDSHEISAVDVVADGTIVLR